MKVEMLQRLSKNQSIGKKLLIWIVFFSSLITILLSGIQLYVDYQVEITDIDMRLDEIENSYKSSVEASLWNVDIEQLEIQMEGIKRLPDVQAVIVKEKQDIDSAIFLQKGDKDNYGVFRNYDLIQIDGSDVIHIGNLYVEISLKAVYQRLFNKALTIILVQGVKTFFVSLFILLVFYRLVTRHLITIELFLKEVDLKHSFSQLNLFRSKKQPKDELDNLVDAYNSMSSDLRDAYNELKIVNSQLEEDIIARQKAEKEVILLNEELEQRVLLRTAELEAANKELNTFCYSVSHDLRAPMRRIDGFRNNFEELYGDTIDQKGQHYLNRMKVCVMEMNEMIDSFLILSKATSFELVLSAVNLSVVAARIMERLQEKESHRDIRLHIQDDVIARCDVRLVELLLSNLLENAWKYTSKMPFTRIRFYTKEMEGAVVYIVEDNGVGFDMELAGNLFAPFTRLHLPQDFQGVGIGLATVRRIVARHGGKVWADASVNQGATFYFTLKQTV